MSRFLLFASLVIGACTDSSTGIDIATLECPPDSQLGAGLGRHAGRDVHRVRRACEELGRAGSAVGARPAQF